MVRKRQGQNIISGNVTFVENGYGNRKVARIYGKNHKPGSHITHSSATTLRNKAGNKLRKQKIDYDHKTYVGRNPRRRK